jgi:hypothetical protein
MAMQCITGSLLHCLVSNFSFIAEILISLPDPIGGQTLGSEIPASSGIPHPVVVQQLYTCGIPSTIRAIMRASLWTGSAGPGGFSRPAFPWGEGTVVPVVAQVPQLPLVLDLLALFRLDSAEGAPAEG